MSRAKIAFRNVLRNRARSALSASMIAAAVAGVVAFRGFSGHILTLLKNTTIDNRYNHLQIASRAYWDMAPGPRKAQLIPNGKEIARKAAQAPGVAWASGRLSFFGLASTGETTVSAQGVGYDPQMETHLQKSLVIESGRALEPGAKMEAIVGVGLQKRLNLKVGDTLTALAYTLDGVVNAADLQVVGFFRVGTMDVDNSTFMMPLSGAQQLLDTDAIENLTIRAQDGDRVDEMLPALQTIAAGFDPEYQTKTWYQISDHYRRIEQFYTTQNRVVEAILASLILLSIMNSVGMSVFERTGEIGTVRALGEKPSAIVSQFMLEGAILGAIGAVCGWALGAALSLLLAKIGLTMVLPNASFPVPILIQLSPGAFLASGAIGLFAAVASTLIPSIRASRIEIVEALRKNA